MTKRLPKDFMEEYSEARSYCEMHGVPIEDLDKDEMLASMRFLIETADVERERHIRAMRSNLELIKELATALGR